MAPNDVKILFKNLVRNSEPSKILGTRLGAETKHRKVKNMVA